MNTEEAIRQLQDALEFSRTEANASEKVGYMREAIRAALEALKQPETK